MTSPIAQTFSAARIRSSTSIGAARADREPERLEALRRSAAGLSRRAAARRPIRSPPSTAAPPSKASTPAPSPDVDAVLPQRLLDERRRVGVERAVGAGRRPGRASPSSRPGRRTARARSRPARRRARAATPGASERLGRLDVRPVVDVVDPGDRRDHRARAGRDHEPVVRELAAVDLDDAGTRDRASPRTSSQPRAASHSTCEVSSRSADEVAPAEHSGRVDPGRRDPRRPPRRGDELRRPEHRLRRHARPVGALAADEAALDERELGLVVEPAEGADEMLAGRPSTENDDLKSLHQQAVGLQELLGHVGRRTSCRRSTALFMAMIAGSVSFAETALTVFVKSSRPPGRPRSSRSAPRSGSR